MEKINLATGNINEIKARLLTVIRSCPDILDPNFEKKVRQKINLNFDHPNIRTVENHFILFLIGEPSDFDKLLSI
jgi:hypothetical protein